MIGVFPPPSDIIDASISFWKDHLIGFFLDDPPSFSSVKGHVLRAWRLCDSGEIRCDNSNASSNSPAL